MTDLIDIDQQIEHGEWCYASVEQDDGSTRHYATNITGGRGDWRNLHRPVNFDPWAQMTPRDFRTLVEIDFHRGMPGQYWTPADLDLAAQLVALTRHKERMISRRRERRAVWYASFFTACVCLATVLGAAVVLT